MNTSRKSIKTAAFLAVGSLSEMTFAEVGSAQSYSGGSTIEQINTHIKSLATSTFDMIKYASILFGLIVVIIGLNRLKKSQDQSSGVSASQGLILILVGGCFAVLPFILFTAANTVQDTQ